VWLSATASSRTAAALPLPSVVLIHGWLTDRRFALGLGPVRLPWCALRRVGRRAGWSGGGQGRGSAAMAPSSG